MIAAAADFGIPLAAVIIGAFVFALNARVLRRKADLDDVDQLRARLADHERRLKVCEDVRDGLMDENARLMRKVLRLEDEHEP